MKSTRSKTRKPAKPKHTATTKARSGAELYEFRIDAFTPQTIPMARLAEYLKEWACLLGEPERVHFKQIATGSTVLRSEVEREAVPKVRERLARLDSPQAREQAADHFRRLNDMLRSDNATGVLKVGRAVILRFPGRDAEPPSRIGPFSQPTELEGMLVRIGGKDETAHGTFEDAEGNTWICELNRDLARRMAPNLFGNPLRVSGTGRWERDEAGTWLLRSFRATAFSELVEASLDVTIAKLREAVGNKKLGPRPIARLKLIRGSDSDKDSE